MRIVVDYLAQGNRYRSARKIVHKAACIKMIRILSGDINVGDTEKWLEENKIREEDEITVCELFDQYVRQGKKEGRGEGVAYGEARRLVEDIENVMKFFGVTLDRACEGLGTTVGKYEEARRRLWRA